MHWREDPASLLSPLATRARVGLISDFDGTLAPIVTHPDQVAVSPRARALVDALRDRLTLVALVSGRRVADLRRLLDLEGLVYVGNHGMEIEADGRVTSTPEVLAYRPQIAAFAAELPLVDGMRLENKLVTLSIHYRQAADPTAIEAQYTPLLQARADEHGLRLFRGRMVFEVRPPLEINKGTAFRALVAEHQLDAAVFLGDDTTDADALRAARALRDEGVCHGVALGVVSAETPAVVRESADLEVAGVSDVEDFLAWLLEQREGRRQ